MKLIFYDFDIFWFSQCYNILPNKKWIAVFKFLFFFSTLTVYTYFKVFSIDNRDFFYSFRVIFSICITLDSYWIVGFLIYEFLKTCCPPYQFLEYRSLIFASECKE